MSFSTYATARWRENKTKTLKNNSIATIACRYTIQLIYGKSLKFVFLYGMNVWCNELNCVVLWCGKEMNSPLFHMNFTSKLIYFHIYFHTNCYTWREDQLKLSYIIIKTVYTFYFPYSSHRWLILSCGVRLSYLTFNRLVTADAVNSLLAEWTNSSTAAELESSQATQSLSLEWEAGIKFLT